MKKIFTTVLLSVFTLAIFAQTDIIPPQLNTPTDGDDELMPDVLLDWYASAGMGEVTYTLEVDQDENFTAPVEFVTTASSAKMSELRFGNSYYWRVKAADETGDESNWSDVYKFTIIKRFEINKPDNGEMNSPPDEEIKWKTNYGGTLLSGITHIDCQIDTAYFWTNTGSTVTDEILRGVSTIDGKAWAVGEGGTILYFDGSQWTEQESNTGDDLFCVSFLDENNGWAAGEGGTIVYFNGTDWAEQTSNTSDDLFGISFVDANNGWAAGEGGTIVYFNGTDWAEQTSDTSDDLFAISMVDAGAGWAVGDGGTIVAFDGSAWAEQSNPSSKDMFGVSFVDASNGWAVGKSGAIVYYNGTEWVEQESTTTNDLMFVDAMSTSDVWSGGEEGLLVQYYGSEWLEVASGSVDIMLYGISYFGDDFGFIVGEEGTIISKNADAFTSEGNIKSTHSDSTKLILSELFFGKDYYFRIRGRHSQDTSAWSAIRYFSTIDHPVNLAPSDGANNQMLDVLVSWEEISGTYEYIYELCLDPEFSYSCTGYTDTGSFVPQGILFGETYYWHVKARHSTDTTNWSETWEFTVLNQMSHVSPANGSTVLDLFPTLTWQALTGINGIYVAYADNENFTDATVTRIDDVELNTFTIPELLAPGETYYWRCRAFIPGDTTAWSDPWSFTKSGVGINEVLSENNVNIFPNPSNGELHVEMDIVKELDINITISNLLGEVMIEDNYTAHQGVTKRSFDMSEFGKGVYLLKMQSGEEIFTQRIVLK